MGKAASDLARLSGNVAYRGFGCGLNLVVKGFKALPGNRRLEGIRNYGSPDHAFAGVGHSNKGCAPLLGRSLATRVALARALGCAAMIGTTLKRARHPRLEQMVRRLECQNHDGRTAVAGAGILRLLRIEDAAIRGKEFRPAQWPEPRARL